MTETIKGDDLYLEGEEKFGKFSSRLYAVFSGMHLWRIYRQIIDIIGERGPDSLLDVGCGPGDVLIAVARKLRKGTYVGIDPSQTMVNIANRKLHSHSLSKDVSFMVGSSRDPNLDRKFSMIVSSFSFHHWEKKEESLKALLGHLENEGALNIFEMNPNGLYGKVPIVRKHALDLDYAMELQFEGFEKRIEYSNDNRLIILSFRRTGKVELPEAEKSATVN